MALSLSNADQERVHAWLHASSMPKQVALRCRIVLAAARGEQDFEIAGRLKVNRHTVALWRKRVAAEGIDCMWENAPGQGRKPHYDQKKRDAIIEATLQAKPQEGGRWSSRQMAKAHGVSKDTVNRLWELHDLKPHLRRKLKCSHDPRFGNRLTDVVGLYLSRSQRVVVLCGNAENQIRVLSRTKPGLPSEDGRYDAVFRELRQLDGKVTRQCVPRHQRQEFLKFLRRLDQEFPRELKLHLVMDNDETHKTPEVQQWLAHRPRFEKHSIPTGASWVELVKQWFRELTPKARRQGAFASLNDLIKARDAYLVAEHEKPRPFVWTARRKEDLKPVEPPHGDVFGSLPKRLRELLDRRQLPDGGS